MHHSECVLVSEVSSMCIVIVCWMKIYKKWDTCKYIWIDIMYSYGWWLVMMMMGFADPHKATRHTLLPHHYYVMPYSILYCIAWIPHSSMRRSTIYGVLYHKHIYLAVAVICWMIQFLGLFAVLLKNI